MSRLTRLCLALTTVGGTVAALLGGSTTTVGASPARHDGVVSTSPALLTPHLVDSGSFRPVALTVHRTGDTVIVGGKFERVESYNRKYRHARSNLFSFSAANGSVGPLDTQLNGQVWTVLGSGGAVYVGGAFTTVNGRPRPYLAKVDLATGELDPAFAPAVTGGRVTDLQLVGGRLFVSGAFSDRLLALDPVTGADTGYVDVAVADPLQYTTRPEVFRFDVSPDGSQLVGVGNFRTVGGQTHYRTFMLDLGETSATVSPWRYLPLERDCHAAQRSPAFQAYVHDVDFSPDGRFFNLAATGGHRINGEGPGQVLCDAASRFAVADLAPSVPVWVNYTGGDTLHSVLDTGAAVYVQGHSRWLDNPYGRDNAGPGAVSRPGGGAIDPQTGMALAWNPGMPAQRGGYQMYADPWGVWFATDGVRFAGQYRYGIRRVRIG